MLLRLAKFNSFCYIENVSNIGAKNHSIWKKVINQIHITDKLYHIKVHHTPIRRGRIMNPPPMKTKKNFDYEC